MAAGIFGGSAPQQTIGGRLVGSNSDFNTLGASLKDALAYFGGKPQLANNLQPAIESGQLMDQQQQLLNTQNQAREAVLSAGNDPEKLKAAFLQYHLAGGDAAGLMSIQKFGQPELKAFSQEQDLYNVGPDGLPKLVQKGQYKPTPNQAFNSDGSPNVAFQQYEQGKIKAQQAPAWANYGLAQQKLADARSGKIDPDTIGFMADQVLAGDKSAFQNLGRGAQGAENIAALRREVVARGKARNLGGADLAALNAEFSGLQAGERTLGTKTANIEMAASEVQTLAPLALAASEAVNRTQYPSLNKIKLAVDQGTGDEAVIRLNQSVNGLVNTYSRAISPTGTPTVSDKEHAREILETAYTKGQFRAAIDQMQKEIAAARQAPGKVRGEFRSAISGKQHGDASVPDAAGRMPTPQSLPRKPAAGKTVRFEDM